MPARKPSSLITRHETKAERAARMASEESMKGARLPMDAPSFFKGHDRAAAVYREVMRSYSELEADIVSRLDKSFLVRYCILVEELEELREYRAALFAQLKALKLTDQQAFDIAFEKFIKLDARLDRKAELIQRHEQSLYLTPRSRAGVTPTPKQEEPPDPFEEFMKQIDLENEQERRARQNG